jgi:hypothetical protein
MRLLFGIILGAALTVGGAFLHDSNRGGGADPAVDKNMVNWDVVRLQWDTLAGRVREQWNRMSSNENR